MMFLSRPGLYEILWMNWSNYWWGSWRNLNERAEDGFIAGQELDMIMISNWLQEVHQGRAQGDPAPRRTPSPSSPWDGCERKDVNTDLGRPLVRGLIRWSGPGLWLAGGGEESICCILNTISREGSETGLLLVGSLHTDWDHPGSTAYILEMRQINHVGTTRGGILWNIL